MTWPSTLVVARAYVDQLARTQALSSRQVSSLERLMAHSEESHMEANDLKKLSGMSDELEKNAANAKDAADAKRLHALAAILKQPTA